MKKEVKVEYGIARVKPWSKEMYAHNTVVSREVLRKTFIILDDLSESIDLSEDWNLAPEALVQLQRSVCGFGFHGSDYSIEHVLNHTRFELSGLAYFQLKQIAGDLDLELTMEFVGFR